LRAYLQQDLGERLNLEAESDGVKIKIKSVIADDVQTLVFYEITDTTEKHQYIIDYYEGFKVENESKIMDNSAYPRYYYPDFDSVVNNEKKNVYHGKISLRPIWPENGTIQLKVTKLQEVNRDSSDPSRFWGYENMR
jgi:hypothetical protein